MRRANDAYFTGADAIKALFNRVPIVGVTLEPCCGNGAISNFFPFPTVITNDIDPNVKANYHLDAASSLWPVLVKEYRVYDWVITNPPFKNAFDILVEAFSRHKKIAFLLRLSFLEPTYQRQTWLAEHPPTKLIILPRFSFTGDGKTDSVTCAWMLWNYKDSNPIEVVTK